MDSQQSKTCILHKDIETAGELIHTTEKTWGKIVACAKVRIESHNNSSWLKVINQLPSDQPTHGFFHLLCYNALSSLSKTQVSKFEEAK